MKKLIAISMLMVVLLSACGAQTPTTPTPDVLATANAAASTMIALTQAAIPTATLIPPTDTPFPTPTIAPTLPLPPTSSIPTIMPTFTASAGTDNCIHPLNVGEAGPTHRTLVKNQTGGSVNLSLNLYNINAFGQCGAISTSLGKNDSTMVELPAGDWYAYAWVTKGQKQYSASGSFFVQPAQFDKIELCIREDNIVYKPQC